MIVALLKHSDASWQTSWDALWSTEPHESGSWATLPRWEIEASSLADGNSAQCHHSLHPGAAAAGSNLQLFAESSQFGLVSLENPRQEPDCRWSERPIGAGFAALSYF